ncbi:MAG TPA: Ig-like domain-containing protein [Candidatus Acidoferrales bacterium]|nr:Ig-like domain-containing protein [Candidatus Acidoferrales bacterium]
MKTIFVVITLIVVKTFAQSPAQCTQYFQSVSSEFNVPAPILEAIGYIETHWSQGVAGGDRGVMGLRNDSRFSYSLDSAAKLIGLPVDSLLSDPYLNIRGAAALLSEYRNQTNKQSMVVTDSLPTWSGVIARYSGIPQPDIALEFAYHTLQYVQSGVDADGIVILPQSVDLSGFPEPVKATGFIKPGDPIPKPVWVGSPSYNSRSGAPIIFLIIHDTEEQFDYAVSLFENVSDQASAHYLVRSQDGYIDQFVNDSDRAWAVVCWNSITLNIEHEGFVSDSSFYTEAEYESSARLTASLCEKFGIPEDSLHIFGHDAWSYPWFNLIPFSQYVPYVGSGYATCNNHTDPGKYWNWHHYFDLVHRYDSTEVSIVKSSPAANDSAVAAYSNVVINFNTPMDTASTDSAFSITPNVGGGISFNSNHTQLVFHPDAFLVWKTSYDVSISTSAKASNGKNLKTPYEFRFTTVPVDTEGPSVIAESPRDGGTVIPKAYLEFVMNEPVQFNSLSSKITLVDSEGNVVPLSKDMFQVTSSGLTLVAVRSQTSLGSGMKYTFSLLPGVIDYYGVASKGSFSTTFTVDAAVSGGSVIEGFESSLGRWLQPSASSGTFGVDTSVTGFFISYRSYDGYDAGTLKYQFDSVRSVCAEENSEGFDISGVSSIGMWVFGDNSRNELDFIFGSTSEKFLAVDTIDWYGYKYVGMWRDISDASTDVFKGFAIRHLPSALIDSSTIYVDDIQVNGKVTGFRDNKVVHHTSYGLFQNYPNPFNPTTSIGYELPTISYVTLKVYNVLGEEVAALVEARQDSGNHTVTFDASRLPSGIYFYRIVADNFSAIRKMAVIK